MKLSVNLYLALAITCLAVQSANCGFLLDNFDPVANANKAFGGLFNKVQTTVGNTVGGVTNIIKDGVNDVSHVVTGAANKVTDVIGVVTGNTIAEKASDGEANKLGGNTEDAKKENHFAAEICKESVTNIGKTEGDTSKDGVANKGDAVTEATKEENNIILDIFKGLHKTIGNTVAETGNAVRSVASVLGGVVNKVNSTIGNVAEGAKEVITKEVNKVASVGQDNALLGIIKNLQNNVIGGAITKVDDIFKEAVGNVGNTIQNVGFITKIGDDFKDQLKKQSEVVANVVKQVESGIEKVSSELKPGLQKLLNPLQVLSSTFNQGIKEANDNLHNLSSAVSKLLDVLKFIKKVSDFITKIHTSVQNVFGGNKIAKNTDGLMKRILDASNDVMHFYHPDQELQIKN